MEIASDVQTKLRDLADGVSSLLAAFDELLIANEDRDLIVSEQVTETFNRAVELVGLAL